MLISPLAAGYLFKGILQPSGSLNHLLDFVPFVPSETAWLGSETFTIYMVALILVWKSFGIYMLVYIAALNAVPTDVIEAARIDGASTLRVITTIKVPMIAPAFTFNVALALIGSLQSFDLIIATTNGGPGTATGVLNLQVFQTYGSGLYGYASALSVVLFLVVAVLALPLIGLLRLARGRPVSAGPGAPRTRSLTGAARIAFLSLFAVVAVGVPFWVLFVNSAKSTAESNELGLGLPSQWQFVRNYRTVLDEGNLVAATLNTLAIVVPAILITGLVASAASWVFVRRASRPMSALYYLCISGVLLPPIIVTTIYVLKALGIYGGFTGAILFYVGSSSSISVFLITGFVRSIPGRSRRGRTAGRRRQPSRVRLHRAAAAAAGAVHVVGLLVPQHLERSALSILPARRPREGHAFVEFVQLCANPPVRNGVESGIRRRDSGQHRAFGCLFPGSTPNHLGPHRRSRK